MQMFGGILLVAILFTVVALGSQYWRTAEDLDTSRRTAEGFLALIEGLYAYRANNVSQWPTSFSNLTPYLPLLQIDSGDPMQAGANGEGGRYTLAIAGGNVTLATTVSTESHAQAVIREFGSNGTYAAVSNGFQLSVVAPAPGGITLMQQTLLTDGTNKMHRPLWLQNTVTIGTPCTTTGMAVNATGDLMKCDGGAWQPH
ncbi:MAG: hypothetical protein OXG05_14405 [Gammaproteobacteria bacterium]|nr:hypothetical protein [Gammaproteobacteria bacterium]